MSNSHHATHAVTEAAIGAVADLAKRGGASLGSYHAHGLQRAGELVISGAAAVAPGAVAAAAHGTAAVFAGTAAAATAAAPVLAIAAVGYGACKLFQWIND